MFQYTVIGIEAGYEYNSMLILHLEVLKSKIMISHQPQEKKTPRCLSAKGDKAASVSGSGGKICT